MHSLIGRVPDLESGGSEFESRCADTCGDSLIGRVFGCDPKDMGSIPVHHSHLFVTNLGYGLMVRRLTLTQEMEVRFFLP